MEDHHHLVNAANDGQGQPFLHLLTLAACTEVGRVLDALHLFRQYLEEGQLEHLSGAYNPEEDNWFEHIIRIKTDRLDDRQVAFLFEFLYRQPAGPIGRVLAPLWAKHPDAVQFFNPQDTCIVERYKESAKQAVDTDGTRAAFDEITARLESWMST